VTADFVYSRLQKGNDDIATAYDEAELARWADRAKEWAGGHEPEGLVYADPVTRALEKPRDVFIYIIHEGKLRAPQGAMALQGLVDG
jgi:uncharacterized protein YecE (DUF72 family)